MKNVFYRSLLIASISSLFIVATVLAGSTLDRGQLLGYPPVGEINYYAWNNAYQLANGMPAEIITEDGYNTGDGPDLGYYQGATYPTWRIQVRNFDPTMPAGIGNDISMVFGGVAESSGTLWYYTFDYVLSPSTTDHGVVTTTAPGFACPVRNPVVLNPDSSKTISFIGVPNTVYQIYRSELSSGAEPDNGLSNGRYQWLAQAEPTNSNGYGSYTDTTYSQDAPGTWYEILYFDSDGMHGCHSELKGTPTSAVLSNLASSYDLETASVKLSWDTVSDSSILGFNIYRSDDISPDPVKINTELILVYQPGSMEGNQYSYTDAEVDFGQTYTYWVEVVDLEGLTSRFGPVTQVAGFSVFVPILQR